LEQKIEKLKRDIIQGLQEAARHDEQDGSQHDDQMEREGESTPSSRCHHCTSV
jgi:hypothetical protein